GRYEKGKKEGYCKVYKNDILRIEGNFRNNIKNGHWKFYNEDGSIKNIIEYD
ncbi:MAG: hypothetical protein JKY30_01020, partial [Flavobacteriales bacterium]|nr:hypothetical protein [Flavobacteriales bacterium]